MRTAPVNVPFTVIDVETIALSALAVLFFAVWLRDRERGMAWLAAGFALNAAWYFNSEQLHFTGPNMDQPLIMRWGALLAVGIVLLSIGVVRYLGTRLRWLRVLTIACCAPTLLIAVLLLAGVPVPRRAFHVAGMICYAGAAVVAFRRHFDEPGAGHLVLGVVLLTLPLTPFVLILMRVDPSLLRYFAAIPVMLFGMILLTVSLLRRRHLLEAEVALRTRAEESLRQTNAQLEQRVAERTMHLQEIVAALEGFNRSVSHDLRGPLGGIAEFARLAGTALVHGDDSIARRALPMIATQADASSRLVTTLLELARLGDAPIRRRRVALSTLVNDAFESVALGRGSHRMPVLNCGELPEIDADADLLRPVLVNLIGNAAKFSCESSSPTISIDAQRDGDGVVVSVADNGVGFGADCAVAMFEPFRRFHDQRFEGHGLGLSIVRRAVERHGGRVWAESSPGAGATFRFSIPGASIAAAAAAT